MNTQLIAAIFTLLLVGILLTTLSLREAFRGEKVGEWIVPLIFGIAFCLLAVLFAAGFIFYGLITGDDT